MEQVQVTQDPPRRVLLVEDDEMHAELIGRAFEDHPAITLMVARRLDEAVEALQQDLPDMVLADLRLPDGRGIELCSGRDFPIIIMTSQGSETDAVEAMRAGALDYIIKSDVMFEDMPHVVERALREWGLQRAHERANRQLQSQYEIASALATSGTLYEAGPRILESICRCVGWSVGELWQVEPTDERLHRRAYFALEPQSRRLELEGPGPLARGEGLAGATWAHGAPLLVTRSTAPPSDQSPSIADQLGLCCGYGFPVHTSDRRISALFTFYAHDIDTPTGDDIQRLMGTVSAQLDVFAERERVERERQRLQRELIERERLAAVGETAATLAHEIGNPLHSMYMHTQLLQRRFARMSDVDPKVIEGVELLLFENRRLTKLLDDFRSLSRRHGALGITRVDIAALLDRLLALQRPLFNSGAIEVVQSIEPRLPRVMADQSKLQQVFMNLIKNAVEAMPSGGRLTVVARREGERVCVEVTDTGSGLPEGIDVFEPFRTTKASGTGLGLPVARQLLSMLGGTIVCQSTAGTGTTFRVMLSRLDEEGK